MGNVVKKLRCIRLLPELVQFCPQMNAAAELVNDRRKGLVPIEVTRTSSLEFRIIGIAFKRSAQDKGVMLNTCPWCGASLRWWRKLKKKNKK